MLIDARVAGGRIRDDREVVALGGIRCETPAHPVFENGDQFFYVVLLKADAGAALQATHQPVVEPGEQLRFGVGDEHHRDSSQPIEVIEHAFVLELVDLIENHHVL